MLVEKGNSTREIIIVFILNSEKSWTYDDLPFDDTMIDNLDIYGCVCAGIKSGTNPLGPPKDDLDQACFTWRKCHDCVEENVEETCGNYSFNAAARQCSK